jgi:hypothetical protein
MKRPGLVLVMVGVTGSVREGGFDNLHKKLGTPSTARG